MADSCFKAGKFSAPGFRFHPTDEELVVYYLKRKICGRKLRINAIGVVDVYKVDPSELPGLSMLKTGDRQWFFFTPRNRKYPNAARSSRGTVTGYWKATGKDRVIEYNSRSVGLKKTLVFYRGRAPNGERTDWVMHEYTMDEYELGRCKNAKEYYALYKLYKKSGAGPKNGEQYGAPFQEEEWVDSDSEEGDNVAVPDDPAVVHYENCRPMDDPVVHYENCRRMDDSVVHYDNSRRMDDPVVHYENSRRMDDTKFCNPVNVRLQDIEKLLNEIPDAPGVTTRQFNGFTGVPQGNSAGEIQSTLLNSSSGEFVDPRNTGVFLPNSQPYNRQSSFQSGLKSKNSFEATSGMSPLLDFEKEDYIEMNDLLIPELGASSTEISTHFLNNGEVSDISEFDQLFHDISMSLDADPVFQGTSTDLSSLSNFANNTSDQRQQFIYQQLDQTLENQQNNFMHPSTTLNQFTDSMWFKDGQAALFDQQPQSSSGVFTSHSTGVKPESMNPTVSVNAQNKEGQNGGGTKSQFSSALWELLESIPSTPASACEGPLNQTFVRMSSFSRIRFNGTSVTSKKVTVAKKRISNRGFLLLSIMGALCAIFWVFIATVGVMERPCLS